MTKIMNSKTSSIQQGKQFEKDFASSLPSYCYVHRLKDSAQSYNNSSNTRFAWDNECDFFIWDGLRRIFYGAECKSTKYKSISVQLDKNDKSSKMIKFHQIESLTKMSQYDNTIAGFFCNFRDEENDTQRTYFINIVDFNKMMKNIGKVSFNEIDLLLHKAIKINGNKKRVHFNWNLDEFLESQAQQFNNPNN